MAPAVSDVVATTRRSVNSIIAGAHENTCFNVLEAAHTFTRRTACGMKIAKIGTATRIIDGEGYVKLD
jgi:hypothetical protein